MYIVLVINSADFFDIFIIGGCTKSVSDSPQDRTFQQSPTSSIINNTLIIPVRVAPFEFSVSALYPMAVSPTYKGSAGVAFSASRHTLFTTLLLARRFRHDQSNDSEFVAPCCFLSSFSVATCIPSMLVSACIRLALKHSTPPPY